MDRDVNRVVSCKNVLSNLRGINLENCRIIEEDYCENDNDSVMLRLDEDKSSQEELNSDDDFFYDLGDDKSQGSCGTPRFSKDDKELTIVKVGEEMKEEKSVEKFPFNTARSFPITDLKSPENYLKYVSQYEW
eukprot:CAMPEP_0205813992 /NCGR_PEP_ID=MMETSP0205-20121125/18879_1 /ASSEMBLY_ACC=CAM_ASM_000278 /TAXON_ID=36767 /ORGANISM="Euplotes focardii, Strain TN1" /LENGTH=132 /DNA_ID=CAMNT_0053097091 /DNA_START=315 /DNA_END=710 /DNA_ORIENTATION=-